MARTILIVDDHSGFRASARALLERAGFVVSGEAPDGHSALRLVEAQTPDVMLLDIQLPDMSGMEVARRIASWPKSPLIILTSTRDAADYGSELKTVPAVGFIGKMDLSAEAIKALLGAARDGP